MHPETPPAMWIWINRRGLRRVRTTSAGQPHRFKGVVRGDTSERKHLICSRNGLEKSFSLNQKQLNFDFTSAGNVDGVDFRVQDGGCVWFLVSPGNFSIFVGKHRVSPAPLPLCSVQDRIPL